MTETMKNFLKKVSEDKALAERFSKLDKADLIAAAKELGFELTEADFAQPEGELSEDELAVVSGGAVCFCFVGGGGKREEDASPCGCVLFGNGEDQSAFCVLVGAEVDTRYW